MAHTFGAGTRRRVMVGSDTEATAATSDTGISIPPRDTIGVVGFQLWWGDVEFVDEESGELEYHFGPVAYVELTDGRSHRYQALTVGELNGQMAHLGIEMECPPARLSQVECICDLCTRAVGRRAPTVE
ncbi:hypothetical protein [Candidatus Poriferisodalis sp.]|uniref:hypothetical protein n=1 Tax=Candidatus Poriferisodalis sp. TaxID=3101277 RepID=UPI003B5BD933